ncbi:hypothetical protein SNEBB_007764 [Seison nebaliae]|nr:hypothetical protein SNEBB_007764 [Seison nebaliae]
MVLRELVGAKILQEVFNSSTLPKSSPWRVLVMDRLATRITSACLKMTQIMSTGITIVEDIEKKREPLPLLEAIYLITPTERSIDLLLQDCCDLHNVPYKCFHVFFTESIPDEMFSKISRTRAMRVMKTMKEINIAFLPYESNIFSLDLPEASQAAYNPNFMNRLKVLDGIAEQIATVCSCLGEYPAIRYRAEFESGFQFANLVQAKIDKYKADDPNMGDGAEKMKSQLLILDRGFDAVSPLLHELTIQAMAYDLLNIDNDVYRFKGETANGGEIDKEVILDENDEVWLNLRHKHIADASNAVTSKLKSFMSDKQFGKGKNDQASLKELNKMLKQMPQYRKELNEFSLAVHLAEDCLNIYQERVKYVCEHEQNLAMGCNAEGEKIKDHMKPLVHILMADEYPESDKLRLILLYILNKNGITEENLEKLINHSKLSMDAKKRILNMQLFGLNVCTDMNRTGRLRKNIPTPRKERTERTYNTSRWTPYLKDVLEDAIEEHLDQMKFPFLNNRGPTVTNVNTSARSYGLWHRSGEQTKKQCPRFIVYVLGGVTYSEMRCVYEVMQNEIIKSGKWELIVGGDHIISSKDFLNDLRVLGENEKQMIESHSSNDLNEMSEALLNKV